MREPGALLSGYPREAVKRVLLIQSPISANCYKVRLALHRAGVDYDLLDVDLAAGGARPPVLLRANPHGKVPTVVFPDGRALPESGAILWWFCRGTPWLPEDPWTQAQVLRWMFFEQNVHETSVAVARHLARWRDGDRLHPERMAALRRQGAEAIGVMERALADAPFLAGAQPTIADIALYAYTHLAHEAGIPLEPFPAVRAWLERFAALPGHLPMDGPPGRKRASAAGRMPA